LILYRTVKERYLCLYSLDGSAAPANAVPTANQILWRGCEPVWPISCDGRWRNKEVRPSHIRMAL